MGTDVNSCPKCGKPLPAGGPQGLCPRCVMAMNMATQTEFTGEEGPHGTKVLTSTPLPQDLAKEFPELEVLELLGRGGMGAVYKARQKELDRIVALKILPPGIGDTPGFAERFTREAKALAKLNHSNVVTLYEFGRRNGLFFFLMEYVDGVNLRQLLAAGRVAPREALAIVPQICDALQYAHDLGIVHRDIKPDNILMDRRGRVKVADFGLAKIVNEAAAGAAQVSGAETGLNSPSPQSSAQREGEAGPGAVPRELTEAGRVMGTPRYMAPEQEESPLAVDHRADIYALGVVFYQMLTGELPGKPIEPPSKKVQVDVRLDEVVLRALEKNPERRYEQASILKTQVETIAAAVEGGTAPLGQGSRVPGEEPGAKFADQKRHNLKVPAIGLMIAGALNLLPITMPLILRGWRMISDYGPDPAGLFSVSALLIAGIGGLLIFGAMQMLRLQNYGVCVATSILAMTAPPGLLLGLPLGIWSLVLLTRPEVRGAFASNQKSPKAQRQQVAPHFSRTAILGAAWALCFIFASWFLTATEPSGSRPEKPIWETILNFTLLPLGITAPIGATVLGWMSISRIRRSAGRIHGMPLAVLTALLFPMLALDVLIVWFAMGVKLGFGEAVFLCVPIDGFLIWVVWRSLHPPGSAVARRFGWLPAAGSMALVAVVCAGMFVKVMVNKSERARANLEKQLKEDIAELLAEKRITYSRMHFEYSPVLPRALVTFMRLENWRNRTNGEPLSAASGLHLAFDTPGVCIVSGRGDLSDVQRTLFVPDAKALSWPHRVGPTEDDRLGQSGLKPQTGFAATLPDGSFVELVSIMYGSSARRSPGQTNSIDFWNPDGTRLDHDLGWSFGPSNLGSRRDPALDYRMFVVRWGGSDENSPRLMGWQIEDHPQDSVDGQFTVNPKGESAENWIGLGQGFPQGKKTAKLRFALASGPYMTGPEAGLYWSSSGTTPFGSYSIGKIFDHNGNAAVTLTHNLKGCDYRLRVTIDRFPKPQSRLGGFIWEWQEEFRRGERYPAIEGRVVKGGASNQTFEFPGVPAKEAMVRLPSMAFEVRPLRWVEFENVALNPGENIPVRIRVDGGEANASPPTKSAGGLAQAKKRSS